MPRPYFTSLASVQRRGDAREESFYFLEFRLYRNGQLVESVLAARPLVLQLGQAPARIILQYANTMRQEQVAAPPAALQALFGQVEPRIILQYANTARQTPLSYPQALIGDNTPPHISNLAVRKSGSGAFFTWTTNEFADSAVLIGTEPGVYSRTVQGALFLKQHELAVTNLDARTTYFYQVRSADLSGNVGASAEGRLEAQAFLYLPMTTRNR